MITPLSSQDKVLREWGYCRQTAVKNWRFHPLHFSNGGILWILYQGAMKFTQRFKKTWNLYFRSHFLGYFSLKKKQKQKQPPLCTVHPGMLVVKMDLKWGHICTMLALSWCSEMVAAALNDPKPLFWGPRGVRRWPAWPPGRRIKPTLAPSPVSPVRPPEQRLLLGHCKRLLHLDFATIMDDNIFQGLVAGVGRCLLNLLYHILEDKGDTCG